MQLKHPRTNSPYGVKTEAYGVPSQLANAASRRLVGVQACNLQAAAQADRTRRAQEGQRKSGKRCQMEHRRTKDRAEENTKHTGNKNTKTVTKTVTVSFWDAGLKVWGDGKWVMRTGGGMGVVGTGDSCSSYASIHPALAGG